MKPPSLDTRDPKLVGVHPLPTFDVDGPIQKGVLDALQYLNDIRLVPSQTTKSRCHMLPEPLPVKNDIVVLACMVGEHRSCLQAVLPPMGGALVRWQAKFLAKSARAQNSAMQNASEIWRQLRQRVAYVDSASIEPIINTYGNLTFLFLSDDSSDPAAWLALLNYMQCDVSSSKSSRKLEYVSSMPVFSSPRKPNPMLFLHLCRSHPVSLQWACPHVKFAFHSSVIMRYSLSYIYFYNTVHRV